jgi:hypothetical protein
LPGGFVSDVVRVGATVRRHASANTAFVRQLLGLFADRGWPGAPRFLDIDADGREVLDYLEGHVAWQGPQPPGVECDESLAMVARMVRQFHDLTAGTPLAAGEQVVCHNDLSPRNTVYRDFGAGFRPVAFLDWDLAAPGARIHDVAHMCWQYLSLGPRVADLDSALRALRLMCDGYGLADRTELVPTILWWQERCWRGIEAGAEVGDPACLRLRAAGAIESVRADWAWVAYHQHRLAGAVS